MLRGGPEVLDEARGLFDGVGGGRTARLAATFDALRERGVADRVQLDLGLLRDLGYYTGAILEVYDPALGHILGGGGRYDELMGRFGRPLPAAASRSTWSGCTSPRRRRGWRDERTGAVGADRDDGTLRLATPRGSLFDGTLDLLDAIGLDTSAARAAIRGR